LQSFPNRLITGRRLSRRGLLAASSLITLMKPMFALAELSESIDHGAAINMSRVAGSEFVDHVDQTYFRFLDKFISQ
jgi:hypothetical protein